MSLYLYLALYLATIYHRDCNDNYHDLYLKDKIYNMGMVWMGQH